MSDQNPIKPMNPDGAKEHRVRAISCEEWEALLADVQDGALATTDLASFEGHAGTCPGCKEMLSRARQGQEWLQFLAPPPVSPELVGKILARTSGLAAVAATAPAMVGPALAVGPSWKKSAVPLAIRRIAEPRLMMTAAMAFFSLALTLNLAGVRLTAIHMADLNPNQLRSNLSRQFINSKVGVENYCYNLKIVYEMEARVRELKRSNDSEEMQSPEPTRQQSPVNSPKGSAKKGGKSENPHPAEPRAALWGQSVEAVLRSFPACASPGEQAVDKLQPGEPAVITSKTCVRPETGRTEGSLA